jgi:glycosyltransferase involved in cell wall biosynthesis
VRFVGDFRAADREWAEQLGLGDSLELLPYVPRRRSLELQRDSDALLLLLPDVPGRGAAVPSAKVYEYLAAERPILAAVPTDGAAADLVRDADAGVVVAPDDVEAIEAALRDLHARWQAGTLDGAPLDDGLRDRLDRRARARELAALLERVA